MNQEKHWNHIASTYDDEVFDVFQSDKNKVLQKYFAKHANADHDAIDFGCGIGKAFRYLAPSFRKVLAIDISEECLVQARSNPYTNITYKRQDLTEKNLRLPAADFILCCNVAILPEPERDRAIIKNIQKSLRKNGSALVVIPSLESIFYSSWHLIEWYKKEGIKPGRIPKSELNYFKEGMTSVIQGIMNINGVPTKHYLEEEIQVVFRETGLKVTAIEKLEYDWRTEFSSPPAWLKEPQPWDWMVECRKP